MKKAELIKVLLGYENIGEMTEKELSKHTVKELKALQVEMDNELAEEAGETPAEEPDAETPAPAEEPEDDFVPMCGTGFSFDPNPNSGCSLQCKNDFPENFKECKDRFKAQPDKPVGKKPSGEGMNQWYHRPGTQGGLLDKFFTDGLCGTEEEIAKFADCNKRRVMIHIKHLIFDFGVEILKGKKKGDDGKMVTCYFLKEHHKKRKGEVIEGKTGFPHGYPKKHPLYQG